MFATAILLRHFIIWMPRSTYSHVPRDINVYFYVPLNLIYNCISGDIFYIRASVYHVRLVSLAVYCCNYERGGFTCHN